MFSKHPLHEAMKIEPGQWPSKGFTPQEMRVGIAKASYYSTIARNVSATAEHEGWSGEDKFTALAFHLLLRLETLECSHEEVYVRTGAGDARGDREA